jgi:hypothetical protein
VKGLPWGWLHGKVFKIANRQLYHMNFSCLSIHLTGSIGHSFAKKLLVGAAEK